MAPRDAIARLKDLSGKYATAAAGEVPSELSELLTLVALLIETQHRDIQMLKTSLARAEHYIRQHAAPH